MTRKIIKYTIGLPFLILLTVGYIILSISLTIIGAIIWMVFTDATIDVIFDDFLDKIKTIWLN